MDIETTGLVWFGNDLRVLDNNVLAVARQHHDHIIGVYFINPMYFPHFVCYACAWGVERNK